MELGWSLPLRLSKFPKCLILGTSLTRELSSRTSADIAHEFGWKPVKTEEDFQKNFYEEAKAIIEEK